jgi:hypothetical protein
VADGAGAHEEMKVPFASSRECSRVGMLSAWWRMWEKKLTPKNQGQQVGTWHNGK